MWKTKTRAQPTLLRGGPKEVALASNENEKLDRTDDPVRMYLREMGSGRGCRVKVIAIANVKRPQYDDFGLCESP